MSVQLSGKLKEEAEAMMGEMDELKHNLARASNLTVEQVEERLAQGEIDFAKFCFEYGKLPKQEQDRIINFLYYKVLYPNN